MSPDAVATGWSSDGELGRVLSLPGIRVACNPVLDEVRRSAPVGRDGEAPLGRGRAVGNKASRRAPRVIASARRSRARGGAFWPLRDDPRCAVGSTRRCAPRSAGRSIGTCFFGGYPGAASLVDDEERWRRFVPRCAASKPRFHATSSSSCGWMNPALLRALFGLACAYSGQVLSYTKMLGQLTDAGNTTRSTTSFAAPSALRLWR